MRLLTALGIFIVAFVLCVVLYIILMLPFYFIFPQSFTWNTILLSGIGTGIAVGLYNAIIHSR